MCNIPCQLCGDFEECEIRLKQIYRFKVYVDNKFICYTMSTKEEAQSFTFLYPDYTLILDTNDFDNDINDDELIN